MAQPTVPEVLGASAIQDELTITLTKADYANLIATANNSGEALFTAIFLAASEKFNQENQASDSDVDIVIDSNGQEQVVRNTVPYIRHNFSVTIDVLDETATLKPSSLDS